MERGLARDTKVMSHYLVEGSWPLIIQQPVYIFTIEQKERDMDNQMNTGQFTVIEMKGSNLREGVVHYVHKEICTNKKEYQVDVRDMEYYYVLELVTS